MIISNYFLVSKIKRILPFIFILSVNFSSFAQNSCFKGNFNVCNETVATYVADDLGSGSDYTWAIINNTSGGSITTNSNGGSVSVYSGHLQGYIDLQLTASNGSGSYTCLTRITVLAVKANAGPDKVISCLPNSQVTLGSDLTSSRVSFEWNTAAGGHIQGSAETPFPVVDAAGTYILKVTNGIGCVAYDTALVVMTPPPTVTISTGGPTTFCQGNSVTLMAYGTVSYSWSTGEATASVTAAASGNYVVTGYDATGCSNSATVSVNVNPVYSNTINAGICQGSSYALPDGSTTSDAGNYSFNFQSISGCDSIVNVNLIVNPNPEVTISGGNSPIAICAGSNVVLNASGASSYLWSTGETTALMTTDTAGNYVVTGSDANGCTNSAMVTVNVNPVHNNTINAGICQGSSYTLPDGSTTNDAGNYSFNFQSISGCDSIVNVNLIVNPNPEVIIDGNSELAICAGSSVVLNASGASSFLWNTGETTASITVSTGGSYFAVGTDALGCSGTSKEVVVTENPLETPTIDAISSLCITSGAVSLIGSPSGGTFSGTGVTGNNFDPATSGAGTFIITYTLAPDGLCLTSTSVTTEVNVLPPAQTTISISPTVGCQDHTIYFGYGPQNVTLTANSSNIISDYQWFVNGSAIQGATAQTLVVDQAGSYNVVVTAVDGCPSEAGNTVAMEVNTVDVRCGNNNDKVMICSATTTNRGNRQTMCLAPSAVEAHLSNNSGDCLGTCTSGNRMIAENNGHAVNEGLVTKAYPNPFSSVSTIEFERTGNAAHTHVEIYNITGQKMAVLFDNEAEAGVTYKAEFNAENLPAGFYTYTITSENESVSGKLILTDK